MGCSDVSYNRMTDWFDNYLSVLMSLQDTLAEAVSLGKKEDNRHWNSLSLCSAWHQSTAEEHKIPVLKGKLIMCEMQEAEAI